MYNKFHVPQDVLIWVWTVHKGLGRASGHLIQMKNHHTLTMNTPFSHLSIILIVSPLIRMYPTPHIFSKPR